MNKPYIVPHWQAPKGVHALMTIRLGGVSKAPYDTMNVGINTRDDVAAIRENQQHLRGWLREESVRGATAVHPAFLQQVHGNTVVKLDDLRIRSQVLSESITSIQADASYCTTSGLACVVTVADCMPVLLAVPGGVAAAHAGWRGLASGVIQTTLQQLLHTTGCAVHDVVAWLGPCIGANAFEVGEEVRQAFLMQHNDNAQAFLPTAQAGKWWANLPLLGQLTLARCGVVNVYTDGRCTVSDEALFYSYRRDQKRFGDTGRMAACVWLESASS